ncbi:hypothetical protein BGX29_004669 [Mortierella sp. GBA35]|nr:hypothetical protein BGX29_004669 [Mortierella sp. GBA35]
MPSTTNNNKDTSPRKNGSRSPSIARSISSVSTNGDSSKSSTDHRPRWVGAWSSTYTPPPAKSVTRRQSLPPYSNNSNNSSTTTISSRNSNTSGGTQVDEPPPLLAPYSPTLRQPRRRESYDPSVAKKNARGRSPSASVCLAGKGGVFQTKANPCYTANSSNTGSDTRRASICHPICEDDCDLDHADEMENVHSPGEGYVVDHPTSSLEGSPTATASSGATDGKKGRSLDDSLPPLHNLHPSTPTTIKASASSSTSPTTPTGHTWRFALMPTPPLESSPALIRKFLSSEAITGSSFASSSSSSSPGPPLFVTAPAVAVVNPVQYLSKSRVVVTEAINNNGGHPTTSSSSLASALSSTTNASTSDEKESTPNLLAASLLSYETTSTLLEQDGNDHPSSLIRWQTRSPSPLGQSVTGSSVRNSIEEDGSATPTPSRTASLRTKPSIDTLSFDRPGTPSSPAQELFSRIMDQNNDHITSNSRRHSMGSLVDIVTNKARMYLSPSNKSEEGQTTLGGRRTTSSSLGYSPLSASDDNSSRPHRNSISDPLAPPPLPPQHQPNLNQRHQQVVRVSSIESFPRHPSASNLRIQSLRDLFRSSSSSSASASASSNSNSLTSTPNHSRTPTVESVVDPNHHHGANTNSSVRRNSFKDFLPSFTTKAAAPPATTAAAVSLPAEDDGSSTSSSSSSTITHHRSETNGSATSNSTTGSSPCPSPVLRKLGSRSSLALIAPPLVLPQVKHSPKLASATILSLTNDDSSDVNTTASSSSSSAQPNTNNNNNNLTLRRPRFQVLPPSATNSSPNNNKPSPLPSFTVVNEIWTDPTTNTFHQLPGVLLTPSLPFPLTLPIPPFDKYSIATSNNNAATQFATATNGTARAIGGESVEWPWTHMNPTDRDKWPTAFHISAQHGGLLALPPTYSPGSELDEATALSLTARTHSGNIMLDYGSSVMEPCWYFGGGGESVQSSLAGSRVSTGAGSLYYDETLGQTPYGNGFHGGHGQAGHTGLTQHHAYHPSGY